MTKPSTSHFGGRPLIRNPYNYSRDQASRVSAPPQGGPSLTIQSQKDEADINVIVRNFGVTGRLPVTNKVPLYGDFSAFPTDYREALAAVQTADQAFASLPATVRERFANNPAAFLDWAADPSNLDELRSLGLANPLQDAPQAVPGAQATPPATSPKG